MGPQLFPLQRFAVHVSEGKDLPARKEDAEQDMAEWQILHWTDIALKIAKG